MTIRRRVTAIALVAFEAQLILGCGGPPSLEPQVDVSLEDWMGTVPDTASLAQISIPGSHDAGALHDSIVRGTALCQVLDISGQLNAGIRFLDIRCRRVGNLFAIYHGVVDQKLSFEDVMKSCRDFLRLHPSEAILMSIKEESEPLNSTLPFEDVFDLYVQRDVITWSLGESIPTLKQVRGKVVLFRRFEAMKTPKGIDATRWCDNSPLFSIDNGTAKLQVQDEYIVRDNESKWAKILRLLQKAQASGTETMYLNFASGYRPGILGLPDIPAVGDFINGKLLEHLGTRGKGRLGVLLMDYSDAEKAKAVIATNP